MERNVIRGIGKHQLSCYVTPAEARRFEALAREHHGIQPSQLFRRLVFDELRRHHDRELSQPHPDTMP